MPFLLAYLGLEGGEQRRREIKTAIGKVTAFEVASLHVRWRLNGNELTAPASTPRQLAILVGRQQTHLLPIKLAQTSHHNGTRMHIHPQGERICRENRAQVPPGKERLYQYLQARQ